MEHLSSIHRAFTSGLITPEAGLKKLLTDSKVCSWPLSNLLLKSSTEKETQETNHWRIKPYQFLYQHGGVEPQHKYNLSVKERKPFNIYPH